MPFEEHMVFLVSVYPGYSKIDVRLEPGTPPQLVVLLHDFEQFDPVVIQDLFYICRYVHFPTEK